METTLTAKFKFTDETYRSVSFGPYDSNDTAVLYFKAKAQQLKYTMPESFKRNFISENGSECADLEEASITVSKRTVIFAKSSQLAYRAMKEGVDGGSIS